MNNKTPSYSDPPLQSIRRKKEDAKLFPGKAGLQSSYKNENPDVHGFLRSQDGTGEEEDHQNSGRELLSGAERVGYKLSSHTEGPEHTRLSCMFSSETIRQDITL